MKLRDIWGKVTRPVRNWHAFRLDNLQKIGDAVTAKRETIGKIIARRTGYIYINNGLNRKELRTLNAQLRRGAIQPTGRFHAKRQPLSGGARTFAEFQLMNSEGNVPATQNALRENSRRRRAGEPILIFRKVAGQPA